MHPLGHLAPEQLDQRAQRGGRRAAAADVAQDPVQVQAVDPQLDPRLRQALAQHGIEGLRPRLVELAKAAVTVALWMNLAVFLPEQLQGHTFAAQFLVDMQPIGQGLGRSRRCCRGITEQLLNELFFGQVFGQRPSDRGRFGALDVVTDGTDSQTAAASDFSQREVILIFESKDFFDLTHRNFLSCHSGFLSRSLRSVRRAKPSHSAALHCWEPPPSV